MSEYDPSHLAEQNLYGSGREGYGSAQGMAPGHYRGGGNAGGLGSREGGGGGGGGGYNRQRGPRRSGGDGWQGHGGGYGPRGGGGGGGHHQHPRDYYDGEAYNRQRVRDALFRLGDSREGAAAQEFHSPSELYRLKEYIVHEVARSPQTYETLFKSFKVMVTEQPHKISLTAALLAFLALDPSNEPTQQSGLQPVEKPAAAPSEWDDPAPSADNGISAGQSSGNIGLQLVRDLVAAFRTDLDARMWRNVRLFLHLFAALAPLGVVQASSIRSVLSAIAAVLEEPGVNAPRGDRAAVCIIETMCRAGRDLCFSVDAADEEKAVQQLNELVEGVDRYATEYRNVEVELVQPFAPRTDVEEPSEGQDDWLHEDCFETSVNALRILRVREYRRPAFLPSALDLLPAPIVAAVNSKKFDAIVLPDILVPPDDDYADGLGSNAAPHQAGSGHSNDGRARGGKRRGGGIKIETGAKPDEQAAIRAGAGVERVFRYPRWFKDTVPSSDSPESIALRSTVHDIIDLYQVNRKECSKILFDLPRWHRRGTFVGKSVLPDTGIFGDAESTWQLGPDDKLQGGWSLDEVIVESVLSTSLVLPEPPQKPLYYTSLLREVVTISPQSIAPAMGKSVRRVYGALSSGRADAEAIRRFADWFSVHLSNFNFNWNWKEWIPDLLLPDGHPKIAFARRIVELEVRLAYFERIRQSLPDEVQQRLLPAEEPVSSFSYAAEDHPFRERAVGLIQSMRARATAEVILADLEGFRKEITPVSVSSSFLPSDDMNDNSKFKASDEAEAELAIRDVVIQAILSIGSRSFSHFLNIVERYHALLRQLSTSPAMRLAILSSTVRFWHKAPQWILIVVDKWLQYRIIEPTDVIDFVFAPPTDHPEVIRGAVDVARHRDWSTFNWWELIKLTVHKVHGRVDQVRKRLDAVQREETERLERLEAVREAGGATEDTQTTTGSANGTAAQTKPSLFPSGATVSTLPRRPDLPPLEAGGEGEKAAAQSQSQDASVGVNATAPIGGEKKQSVEEVRRAYDNIAQEQRKVLIRTMAGFVAQLDGAPASIWARSGQENNDNAAWQAWWLKGWFIEYCRAFSKTLFANHETVVANVFAGKAEDDVLRDLFERSCQMATE